jgi:F-type H+-transporting ATPase subunit epsilon
MNLQILTPKGLFVEAQTHSVVVPAQDGYMGILKNHAPLMTVLAPGVVSYYDINGKEKVLISTGLMEVSNNQIVILVDHAQKK